MRSGRIGTIALTVLLVFALAILISPMVGYRLDTVRSGSMSPAIKTGDLVISSSVQDEDVHVGDVIIFRHDGVLICHRVIETNLSQGLILTQGDANEGPDPFFVGYDDVVGEVGTVLPSVGHAVSFLRSPLGLGIIIGLGVLLFLYGQYKDKEASRAELDKEDAP